MQLDFSGKSALVTGASSGIGAATAKLLAASGARVVVVGRDRTRLEGVGQEIAAAGGEAVVVPADLTADGGPDEVIAAAQRAGDGIDVLVHAAAILEMSPLADASVESIDRMWNINARAPMLLTRSAVPHLKDRSAIVFVSSTVVHSGFPNYAPYTATKGAIEAFARALAVELAPRTRVNVIAPGFVATPMLTDQYPGAPGLEQWVLERTPLGFICSGEDIAASILSMCCEQTSRYLTGATLVVDGGWTVNL